MVHQLVRGAANGDTESGLAGAASLHEFEFRVTTEVWIGQGRISIPERNRRVAYLRGLKPHSFCRSVTRDKSLACRPDKYFLNRLSRVPCFP